MRGETLKLSFRGKSGKDHTVGVRDRRLARIVRASQELPGQRLFQYVDDDGEPQHVDSDDVNEYLRAAMGHDFSAKDFRTWAGTVLAARAFEVLNANTRREEDAAPTKATLKMVVQEVAQLLGNTPTVCRKSYIHPQLIDSYLDGTLGAILSADASGMLRRRGSLAADERLVLSILKGQRRPRGGAKSKRAA